MTTTGYSIFFVVVVFSAVAIPSKAAELPNIVIVYTDFHMAEYCDTPQSKERRNREYEACLNERTIIRLLYRAVSRNYDVLQVKKFGPFAGDLSSAPIARSRTGEVHTRCFMTTDPLSVVDTARAHSRRRAACHQVGSASSATWPGLS